MRFTMPLVLREYEDALPRTLPDAPGMGRAMDCDEEVHEKLGGCHGEDPAIWIRGRRGV